MPAALPSRLPNRLAQESRQAAVEEERSMNAVVVTAISEYIERRKLEHIRRLSAEFTHDHAEVLRRLARS